MSDSIDDDVNKISNANDHVDDIVESNVVNNNVVKENAMNNNGNNVVNKNTIKNNVENNNVVINNVVGKIVVEFSSVENSALAENNTMEKRNYSPVTVSENIRDFKIGDYVLPTVGREAFGTGTRHRVLP